jgi:NAD(P)-dependent dehydrogenase (short-subunit alcohol dehydrogenase family)
MGTYLITGATGGVGGAIAIALAGHGHRLVLAGRSAGRLRALARSPELAGSAEVLEVDLAHPHRIAPAVERAGGGDRGAARDSGGGGTADRGGGAGGTSGGGDEAAAGDGGRLPARLDGVIHCAGALELGAVAETTPDDWATQMNVNLVGPAELTRVLLPALRAARGHVVFINSGAGLRASARWSAYAASKHGLRALADSLRAEEEHLRVTSVYIGRTATEMQRKVRTQEGHAYDPAEHMDPRTVAGVVTDALGTPRDATVTEISLR